MRPQADYTQLLYKRTLTKSCNKVKRPISIGSELSLLLLRFNTCNGNVHSSVGKLLIWFRLQTKKILNVPVGEVPLFLNHHNNINKFNCV